MDRRDPVTGRFVPKGAPAEQRFHASYERRGERECWPWLAGLTGAGYGAFYPGETQVSAHRFAYELAYGPIPEGLHVHHRCGSRRCCNPAHLVAMTQAEHGWIGGPGGANAAKQVCIHGHPLTGENVIVKPSARRPESGRVWRSCRECVRARKRRARAR